MAMIDTLKLAHALRDKGGFTQETAEGTAEALNEAFTQSAATKADIAELRAELSTMKWVLGFNFAATLGVLLRVVTH